MGRTFIALAGLMGAGGVALAAAAAHYASGVGLDSAAYMLLFHASAVIALTVALDRGLIFRAIGAVAIAGLIIGTVLFAGDLALRAFYQVKPLPMAAPIGGMVMIGAWVVVTLAAALRAQPSDPSS